MASRKHFEIAISTLILLALVLQTPHADAFTSNQTAAIVIGQSKTPYALGGPAGGLAFDPSGNLWVADLQNSRVLGFLAPFSGNRTASIVLGQPDFQSWGSGWFANEMWYPTAVAFDPAGNLWVADSNRVLRFEPPFHNGMNASLVIGQPGFSGPYSGNQYQATRNRLISPSGIVFDVSGGLWVVDSWNGRVLKFQPSFSNGMNASLVIGEPDFTSQCNQEVRPSCGDRRTLNSPTKVALDPAGNLWVTDTVYSIAHWQSRLLEFKPPFTDGMETSLVIPEPSASTSLAFDSDGNLWLGCGVCTRQGGGYVSEYTPPFTEYMNPSLVMGGNITNPTGLSFDSAGNLWVVDSNRILGFDGEVHSVMTATGTVFFKNNDGLLVPLTSIPINRAPKALELPPVTFPYGLFNFTIQGLPADGSVTVTISFPNALPLGMEWWGRQGDQWKRLPATQTHLEGNNMTLIFTHASLGGVISEVGGPAETPANVTAHTETTSISSFSPQNELATAPTSTLASVAGAIAVVTLIVFYWKHKRKQTSPRSVR